MSTPDQRSERAKPADQGTDPVSEPIRQWLREHHHAVLVTLRSDGSPQSSNISFGYDGRTARISVTADRAKTRNVQRDGRVMLHVLGDNFWQYAAVSASATASAVTMQSGDPVGQELLEVYQSIAGPHPDPAEFFAAMTQQRRVVLTLAPLRVTAAGIG